MRTSVRIKLLSTAIIIAAAQFTPASATPQLDPSRIGSNIGVVSLKTTGDTTVLKTDTANSLANFTTIDTAAGQTFEIEQPNASSINFDRVTNGQATQFLGNLSSNGKVVLENSAGLTFGSGSVVNVPALAITTGKGVTQQGTEGVYNFSDFSTNGTVNLDGTINAGSNGYVYVMARHIDVPAGAKIVAPKGYIILEAGSQYYLANLQQKAGISVEGDNVLKQGDITVAGTLTANSGAVVLRARGNDLNSGFINLSGVVDTTNLTGKAAGNVNIGGRNSVNISGTINDSSTGKGGIVRIASPHTVNVTGTVNNSSATGGNHTGIIAYGNANITGTVDVAGTKTSTLGIRTRSNATIGDVQVGDGTANITSRNTTTIQGYVDAQGSNSNALPSQTPNVNGGNINIQSNRGDVVANGYVDSGSLQGTAGKVKITALTGNVTTNTKIAGGTVNITAHKNVTVNNVNSNPKDPDYITAYNGGYTTGAGTGGNVNLKAGGNTTVNAPIVTGNINSGGNLTVTSKGATTINSNVVTLSSKGKGGNVVLKGKTVTAASDVNFETAGATGNGTLTVNGVKE